MQHRRHDHGTAGGLCPEKLVGGSLKVTELDFEEWIWMIQAGGWWGILQTVGVEWRAFIRSSAELLPVAQGKLKPATTFPLIDAGLSTTLCPGPPIPSFCQNTREGYLYQEEPAWLIPIHLQLLQLRQHSHSGKTGYLRVILLFELFVLFWNLWHLKNRPAFQVIDQ